MLVGVCKIFNYVSRQIFKKEVLDFLHISNNLGHNTFDFCHLIKMKAIYQGAAILSCQLLINDFKRFLTIY